MFRKMLLVLALGCSDYQVHKTGEPNPGAEEVPQIDTAEPRDTGSPTTDTGEPPGDEPIEEPPDEPVYLHTASTLYAWDPVDGILHLVGDFFRADGGMVEGITDIAIDHVGRFYGVSWDSVFYVNGHTAELTHVSPLDSPLYGLTCTSDGRLIGGGDGLVEIDPLTGVQTPLVPAGRYETSGDLVGLPDGLLYWVVREGDDLVIVDPATGTTSMRGEIGVGHIYGVGYSGGLLYGFTDAGQVLEIDPSNGNVLSTRSLPGEWWGATTNPVVW
jgi:hypothetical protein